MSLSSIETSLILSIWLWWKSKNEICKGEYKLDDIDFMTDWTGTLYQQRIFLKDLDQIGTAIIVGLHHVPLRKINTETQT